MIFVGKNSKTLIRAVIALILAAGLNFTGIANAGEIQDGGNEWENLQNREKEENQIAENIEYYTQNVYFTENEQLYVVVNPDDSYVSLKRNKNAENKSEKEVCQFL